MIVLYAADFRGSCDNVDLVTELTQTIGEIVFVDLVELNAICKNALWIQSLNGIESWIGAVSHVEGE